MDSGVKITKDMLPDVLKAVRELTKKQVLVGIPDSTAERAADEGKEPISNAEIGYLMETGIPEKNVPARPFLVPGVEKAKDKIVPQMKTAGEQALSGDVKKVDVAFNKAGILAVNSVKAGITDGIPPPLAPATIAAREARGRTGTTPLIDTGALLNSLTYVIRDKGKD